MTHSATYDALLETCRQPGCPVCQMEQASVRRYLDHLFYEQVNDYALRRHIRASLGFCPEHARLAMDGMIGNAFGLAILYEDLLRVTLTQLEQQQKVAAPREVCPACAHLDSLRRRIWVEFSKHLPDEEFIAALETSQGLCIPHLRQVLEHLPQADKRNALLAIQMESMKSLRVELAEFIRKNDYQFSGEPFGGERDSWQRAVRLISGHKNEH